MKESLSTFGFAAPIPVVGLVLGGLNWQGLSVILVTAIIVVSWLGGARYFEGIPAGLSAIATGSLVAWGSSALGFNYGGMTGKAFAQTVANFGFRIPLPAFGHVPSGFQFLGVILVTAIPLRHLRAVETLPIRRAAGVWIEGFEFATGPVEFHEQRPIRQRAGEVILELDAVMRAGSA